MEFQSTRDGCEATRIGNTVYAIVPHNGRIALKQAWTNKSPADLDDSDFWMPDFFDTVDQAKADLADLVVHHAQKAAFGYRDVPCNTRTMWGQSQGKTVLTEGVENHTTEGHGGFKLDRRHNAMVDKAWRQSGGWYEQDGNWAIVAATFPELFTDRERRKADRTLRNSFPDQYEAVYGVVLTEDESMVKAERAFNIRHKDDYVVIAASGQDDGTVICHASMGGERQRHDGPVIEVKQFIVPKGEYVVGRFGFVIDLDRHAEIGAPAPGMSI